MRSIASKCKQLCLVWAAVILGLILTGCDTRRGELPPDIPQPSIPEAKPTALMSIVTPLPELPPPTPTKGLTPEQQAKAVADDYIVASSIAGRCLIVLPGLIEWIKRQE